MQLDLSANEVAILATLVDSALRDTREQVYKAAVPDYKQALRQREALLTSLLQRLGAPQAAS
jgi:hypothetical protein